MCIYYNKFESFCTSPPSLHEMEDGEEEDDEEIMMEPIDIQTVIQPTVTSTVKLPIHHRCAAHSESICKGCRGEARGC